MKKAFVFDFDGTLVNSIYDLGDSVNSLLLKRGLPARSYDDYLRFVGMGIGATLSKAMPGYDDLPPEEQQKLRNEYTLHNEAHCMDKTKPYEGMVPALGELASRNMILGIFTNKPELLGKKIAAELFKAIDFAFILGNVEGKSLKPDPSRVLEELEKLNIDPSEAVFVGDGEPDIAVGKNGGMTACGVLWGYKGMGELGAADIIISHPRELLDII
jgi:phosphoglycolate phosphatase